MEKNSFNPIISKEHRLVRRLSLVSEDNMAMLAGNEGRRENK